MTILEYGWTPSELGFIPTMQPGLRTLIVGAGEAGRALARDLEKVSEFGLAPIGFLKPDDPRYRSTVEAIERDLLVDGLVLRYDSLKSKDGLPAGEGAFLACSFWLVDAYLLLGRRDDAEQLFGRLVSLCNDVGLLSEEYDPHAKRQLGNFPQAFSHIALINSAFNLTRAEKPAVQRADNPKGSAQEAEEAAI